MKTKTFFSLFAALGSLMVASVLSADSPGDPLGYEGMSVFLNKSIDARYRYDRFYSGSDRDFIGKGVDWSGVGRQVTTAGPGWATMIAPDYFVTATHTVTTGYSGASIRFYTDNSGSSYVDRTISATGWNLGNDVWVGRFEPLTLQADKDKMAQVATYPILNSQATDDYVGQELYMFGQSARNGSILSQIQRLGRNVIQQADVPHGLSWQHGSTYDYKGTVADISGPDGVGDGKLNHWDWDKVVSKLNQTNVAYVDGDVTRSFSAGGTGSPGVVNLDDLNVLYDQAIGYNGPSGTSGGIGWDEASGVSGDSGAPRFRLIDGKPALVGTASSANSATILGLFFSDIASTIASSSGGSQNPASLTVMRGTPYASRAGVSLPNGLDDVPYIYRGDLNGDFVENADDIDFLNREINAAAANATRPKNWALDFDGVSGLTRGLDLQPGSTATTGDLTQFLKAFGTLYGDTDLSGEVEFTSDGYGTFTTGPTSAGWAGMDFNGNGSLGFTSDFNPGHANDGPAYRQLRAIDLDFAGNDGVLNASDIDVLAAEIRNSTNDADFDVTLDGVVDQDDYEFYVFQIIGALRGDLNLNGVINTVSDYNSMSVGPGGWADGDLDGDGYVYQAEIDYVAAALASLNIKALGTLPPYPVPEPRSILMLAVAGWCWVTCLRHRTHC